MLLTPVLALRDRLRGDADLVVWEQATLGRAAGHFIGLAKPRGVQDCPGVFYTPSQEPGNTEERVQAISLVFAVNQPGETDGVFDGLRRAAEFSERALDVLLADRHLGEGLYLQPRFDAISDLGARHPIFQIELVVYVAWLAVDPYSMTPATGAPLSQITFDPPIP